MGRAKSHSITFIISTLLIVSLLLGIFPVSSFGLSTNSLILPPFPRLETIKLDSSKSQLTDSQTSSTPKESSQRTSQTATLSQANYFEKITVQSQSSSTRRKVASSKDSQSSSLSLDQLQEQTQEQPQNQDVPQNQPPYKEGEVLVKFKEGITQDQIDTIFNSLGLGVISSNEATGSYRLRVPDDTTTEQMIETLSSLPQIESVEPNYEVSLDDPVDTSSESNGQPGNKQLTPPELPTPNQGESMVDALKRQAGWQEIVGERTETSKNFVNPQGNKVALISSGACHFQDSQGEWQEIDNNLVFNSENQTYQNKANSFKVTFSASPASNLIVYKKGNTQFTWSLFGVSNSSSAEIKNNTIIYTNIYPQVDLKYEVLDSGVKEEIILNEYRGENSFSFSLKLENLELIKEANGTVNIYDPVQKETVFLIPRPYMYDSSQDVDGLPAISDKVDVVVSSQQGNFIYTVVVDPSWLSDSDRVYPIVIDPGYQTPGPSQDTYVTSGLGTTVYYTNTFLIAGLTSNVGVTRSFLQFGLPSIPNCLIKAASVFVFAYEGYNTDMDTNLWQVTSPWSEASTCWNNQPGRGGIIAAVRRKDIAWWEFPVTGLVQAWYSGTPNYGVALTVDPENVNSPRKWFSGNYPDPAARPWLAMSYNSVPTVTAVYTPLDNQYLKVSQPTFVFDFSSDADNDPVWAQIQVAKDSNFSIGMFYLYPGLSNKSYVVPPALASFFSDGKYYWRVKVCDGYDYSSWSATRCLYVETKHNAEYLATVPTYLPSALTLTVPVTIKNTGTDRWKKGQEKLSYHLEGAAIGDGGKTELPYDVPVGQSVTLDAIVTTPAVTGSLTIKFDLVEGTTWFSGQGVPTCNKTTTLQNQYNATYAASRAPPLVKPWQSFQMAITVTNKSNFTWASSGLNPVKLTYRIYNQSGDCWYGLKTPLVLDLPPGQSVTLNCLLTAPNPPGTYIIKWDIIQENITLFSDKGVPTFDQPLAVSPLGSNSFWPFAGPVNLFSGNLVLSASDFSLSGRGPEVTIERTYNSHSDAQGVFGLRWQADFETKLIVSTNVVMQASDGEVLVFYNNGDGTYASPPGIFLQLTKYTKSDGSTDYFTIKQKDQTIFTFDASGRLLKETDDNNNSVVYGYNATTGRLDTITDASGRKFYLYYDGTGKLSYVKVPSAATRGYSFITYGYTGSNLTSVTFDPTTDPPGGANAGGLNIVTQYGYNATTGKLTTITNAEREVVTFTYDADGKIKEIIDPRSTAIKTTYTYDPNNSKTTVTDANGNPTIYTYNKYFNPSSVADPSDSLINDDFNSGSYTGWTISGVGSASVVNSKLRLDNVRAEKTFTNSAEVIAEFKAIRNLGYGGAPSSHINIVASDGTNSLVSWALYASNSSYLPDKFEWGYKVDGSFETIRQISLPNNYNQEYQVKLVVGSSVIQVYVDGTLRDSFIRTNRQKTFNKAVLIAESAQVDFDDIKVTRTPVYLYWDSKNNKLAEEGTLSETIYEYDNGNIITKGNLTKIFSVDKKQDTLSCNILTYDANDNLLSAKDEKGNKTQVIYDKSNNPINVADGNDNTQVLGYDQYGNLIYQTKYISSSSNLVYNSGFEKDFTDWSYNANATFTVGTATPLSGQKALRITKSDWKQSSDNYAEIYQTIPVKELTDYTLSVSYKGDFTQGQGYERTVGVVAWFRDLCSDTSQPFINWGWASQTSWSTKVLSFKTPKNTTHIRLDLRMSTNGYVLFDNIQLAENQTSSSYNILENAGFERDPNQDELPDGWTYSKWPIFVEGATQLDSGKSGGRGSGLINASNDWYFPEGYTGDTTRNEWISIYNPNDVLASLTCTAYGENGVQYTHSRSVVGKSRASICVDTDFRNGSNPIPSNYSISIRVHSDQPIYAEAATFLDNGKGGDRSAGMTKSSKLWCLPEGYTGDTTRDEYVAMFNPNDIAVEVTFTSYDQNGTTYTYGPLSIAPCSRATLRVDNYVPAWTSVATLIRVTKPADPLDPDKGIFVEGVTFFNGGLDGARSPAICYPSTQWYFPEGYTGDNNRSEWIALFNPNDTPVSVTCRSYQQDGTVCTPATNPFEIPARRRANINLDSFVPADKSVATTLFSNLPIYAEAATQLDGGKAGARNSGLTQSSAIWYLPEGYTGDATRNEYVTIFNPNNATIEVKCTSYKTDGSTTPPSSSVVVGPNRRATVNIDGYVGEGINVATVVETKLVSTSWKLWDTFDAFEGEHSLKQMHDTATDSSYWYQETPNGSITPGKEYTFTSWVKTDGLDIDNFNDDILDNWQPETGVWRVENGELSQSDTGLERTCCILVGDKAAKNYTLQTKVKLLSSSEEAQLIFRAQDKDNHYEVWFRGREESGGGDVHFRKKVNGVYTDLGGIVKLPFNVEQNKWYDLKLVCQNDTFSLYVNGSQVPLAQVTDSTYSCGKIGFSTWMTHAHFDDVRLTVPGGTGGAGIKVEWLDSSSAKIKEEVSTLVQTNGKWQLSAFSATAPASANKVRVYLIQSNFEGSVWFDAARIEQDATTRYEYDALGNYQTKVINPLGSTTENTYDAVGNVLTATTTKTNLDLTKTTETVTCTYDAASRRLTANTPQGEAWADTEPPTVTITAPTTAVTGTVTIQADALDNQGVSKVEFYIDGTLAATDTTYPYTCSWNTASYTAGEHILEAKAYDSSGNFSNHRMDVAVTSSSTISNVQTLSITQTQATIAWTTAEATDSQVEYGLTTAYGSATAILDTGRVTSHSVNLSGLAAATLYHFRVKSTNALGTLSVSSDYTFTTQSTSSPITYGFAAPYSSTGGVYINSTTAKCDYFFTAPSNMTVTSVGIQGYGYKGDAFNSLYIKAGIQQDTSGNPSGSYLGYGLFTFSSTSTSLKWVTLFSSVTLTAGQKYHLVVEYSSGPVGTISTSNYWRCYYPTGGNTNTGWGVKSGSGTTWTSISGVDPCFILKNSTVWGQPYYAATNTSIYTNSSVYSIYKQGEKFTPSTNLSVTSASFEVSKSSFTTADLMARIDDGLGNNLATASVPYTSVLTSYSWVKFNFSKPVNLTAGATYRVYLTSVTSSSAPYYLRYAYTLSSDTTAKDLTWVGQTNCYDYSSNGTWTSYTYADVKFKLEGTCMADPLVTLQPGLRAKDTTINNLTGYQTYNYGAMSWIAAGGSTSVGTKRALLEFDLSSIPTGSTIVSASLSLYCSSDFAGGTAYQFDVHRLNSSWKEGTGTETANSSTINGATWNESSYGVAWSAGGNYNSTASASTSVGAANQWYSFSIKDLVQGWVSGTYSNYGLLIKANNEAVNNQKWFRSADYTTNVTLRPKLVIKCLPPSGTPAISTTTNYYYDRTGRLTRVVDPQGNVASTIYLPGGLVSTVTDALGVTTKCEYDNNGNRTKVISDYGDASHVNQTTTYQYNQLNQLTKVTDPELYSTSFEYDEVGNKTKETNALGNVATFAYDGQGQLISQTLPTPATPPDPIFLDNFANSKPVDWTTVSGTWKTESGVLSQDDTSLSRSCILAGDTTWDNYTYEAKVKLCSSNEEALLLFRAQDQNNHYELSFRGRTYDDLVINKKINGASTFLGQVSLGFDVLQNVWYDLKLVASGSTFTAYVNGTQKLSVTDSTFATGKIGLSTWMSHAHFDDVKVTPQATSNTSYNAYDLVGNLVGVTAPGYSSYGTNVALSSKGASVISSNTSQDKDRNLLNNNSFEGSTDGWTFINGGNWAIYKNPNVSKDSDWFLEANRGSSVSSFYQDVQVQDPSGNNRNLNVGESYTFSIWVRSASGTPVSGGICLWGLGGTQENAVKTFTTSSKQWIKISTTLKVQNKDHNILRAEIYLYTIGQNYDFDGASLQNNYLDFLIDGNTKDYDGYVGFAETTWGTNVSPPGYITVVLDKVYQISAIRMLLWDKDPTPPGRYYRYKIETSLDNVNWKLVADKTTGENRSWQNITLSPTPVKFIKLTGTFNSANNNFHVVELEAYTSSMTTTYDYDKEDQLAEVVDPLGYITRQIYDSDGLVVAKIDAKGNVTSFDYDALGRLIKTTDAYGYSTTAQYDELGNTLKISDQLGHSSTSLYDARNLSTKTTNPIGHVTEQTYDNLNQLVRKISHRLNFNGTADQDIVSTASYDKLGRVVSSVFDPYGLNIRSSQEYDALGRTTKAWDGKGTSSQGTYNPRNLLTTAINKLTIQAKFEYDKLGRQTVSILDPTGLNQKTTFGYDELSRLTTVTDARGNETGANPANYSTTYKYDLLGRKTSMTDSKGTTYYFYDRDGRLASLVDPLGVKLVYTYDPSNNLLNITDGSKEMKYDYDFMNRLSKEEDTSTAKIINYTYDAQGRLTQVSYSDGKTTAYTYDNDDRLTKVTESDNRGLIACFSFDEGQGTTATDKSTSLNNGTIYGATWTDGKYGKALSFDGVNDYVITSSLGKLRSVTVEAWFKANGAGVIVSEVGQAAINTGWHDSWIEVQSDGKVFGRVWSLNWSNPGIQIGTVSFGTWNHVVLVYDDATKLLTGYLNGIKSISTLSGNRDDPASYGYEQRFALGAVDSTGAFGIGSGRWFNGTIDEVRIYNRALSADEVKNSYQPKAVNYQYDSQDNLTYFQDITAATTTYAYDKANRLTTVKNQSGQVIGSFEYDANSNLVKKAVNGITTTYTYNQGDQLTALLATNQVGTVIQNFTYQYDNAGNLKVMIDNLNSANNKTYTYDKANELKTDGIYTYTYDGNGNLLSKVSPSNVYYQANALPHNSSPAWTRYAFGSFPEVYQELITYSSEASSNVLDATCKASGDLYYYVSDSQANASTGVTIEARLKTANSSSSAYQYLLIEAGSAKDYLYIYSNKIALGTSGATYNMNTANAYHTYCYTIGPDGASTKAKVYVDGVLVLTNNPMTSPDPNYFSRKVAFSIGEYSSSDARCLVDYVSYSTKGVFPELGCTTTYTYNAANQLTSDGTKSLSYDSYGNLTSNGTYNFYYDAKNRLIKVTKARFLDNFDSPTLSSSWQALSGTWQAEASELSGDTTNTSTGYIQSNQTLDQVEISFKVRFLKGYTPADNCARVILCDSAGNDIHYAMYTKDSTYGPSQFFIGQHEGASWTFIQTAFNKAIEYNNTYQVKLVISSTKAQVYLDGVFQGEYTRPVSRTYPQLKLGLTAAHAHFDDVRVAALNEETVAEYAYDASGRRTQKKNSSTVNYYYNDLSKRAVVELDQNGNLLRRYTTPPGAYASPLTVTISGTTYYYLYNGQGDVVALLNSSGNKVASWTYDSWGKPTEYNASSTQVAVGTFGNPYLYRGYYYDTETGLYYLNARYYDPTTGRFISRDPAGSNQTDRIDNNSYLYCKNNPVSKEDPSGLKSYYWHYRHYNYLYNKYKKDEYRRTRERYRAKYLGLSKGEKTAQRNGYWAAAYWEKAKKAFKSGKYVEAAKHAWKAADRTSKANKARAEQIKKKVTKEVTKAVKQLGKVLKEGMISPKPTYAAKSPSSPQSNPILEALKAGEPTIPTSSRVILEGLLTIASCPEGRDILKNLDRVDISSVYRGPGRDGSDWGLFITIDEYECGREAERIYHDVADSLPKSGPLAQSFSWWHKTMNLPRSQGEKAVEKLYSAPSTDKPPLGWTPMVTVIPYVPPHFDVYLNRYYDFNSASAALVIAHELEHVEQELRPTPWW